MTALALKLGFFIIFACEEISKSGRVFKVANSESRPCFCCIKMIVTIVSRDSLLH